MDILRLRTLMTPEKDNIFENIPAIIPEELFENLLAQENLKIERIISHGHYTPTGEWYAQVWDEWVLLLQGKAILGYENGGTVKLQVGDYAYIPAHTRHRVEWTQPDSNTIWLAVHFMPS
jgi:cupin 2 domain-containing protein